MNKSVKLLLLFGTIFFVLLFIGIYSYFIFVKKQNKTEEIKLNSESQNAGNNQQEQIEELSNELQQYKDEQARKEADEQLQNKKDDCVERLRLAEVSLASAKKNLAADQKELQPAESGKCNDCYKPCIERYGCASDQNPDSVNCEKFKKTCKELNDSNLKNRRLDVSRDLARVNQTETELQSIKNECAQYN